MPDSITREPSGIFGQITHTNKSGPVAYAEVELVHIATGNEPRTSPGSYLERVETNAAGRFQFSNKHGDGQFLVRCRAFTRIKEHEPVTVAGGSAPAVQLDMADVGFGIATLSYGQDEQLVAALRAVVGKPLVVRAAWPDGTSIEKVRWTPPRGAASIELDYRELELMFARAGKTSMEASGVDANRNSFGNHPEAIIFPEIVVSQAEVSSISGNVGVTLHRTASEPTLDQALWVAIRNRTNAISFNRYREFLNRVLRWEEHDRGLPDQIQRRLRDLGTNLHGVGAYQVLKTATEMFLLIECGVGIEFGSRRNPKFDPLEEAARLGEPVTAAEIADRLRQYLGHPPQLPYITRIIEAAFPELERVASQGERVLISRINEPCLIELIWSYWHEEGMLVQSINALSQRFQNIRRPGDALLNLEVDPLRPVNNLLWGYIQDEINRLSVSRRAYEYQHEYGLGLYGRATAGMTPAETRSKFLGAFHYLLYQASKFFKEDNQTTVVPDGFPLLNALQEVHMILAQGAHNQFGDLPWTARTEMLLGQFILARPEIRDFLQSRVMVPYKEAWMAQVDAMKALQGWTDVTVTHFRDLGVYGEQLLLSIRYGDWMDVNDENSAKNWARYWKREIEGYIHATYSATGADLTNPNSLDGTIPALLLQQRRQSIQQRPR